MKPPIVIVLVLIAFVYAGNKLFSKPEVKQVPHMTYIDNNNATPEEIQTKQQVYKDYLKLAANCGFLGSCPITETSIQCPREFEPKLVTCLKYIKETLQPINNQ